MEYKLIESWYKRNLKCHFCNTEKSVKYEMKIFDPVIDTKPTSICVCNKCVITRNKGEK